MYELVELRRDEIFTNSKVIAEGTGNKHEIYKDYKDRIEQFKDIAYLAA